MADPIVETNVFKFVAVRPPNKPDPDQLSRNFLRDKRALDKTALRSLAGTGGNSARRLAGEMAHQLQFSPNDPVGNDHPDLMRLWSFLRTVTPTTAQGLSVQITNALGQTPEEILKNAHN